MTRKPRNIAASVRDRISKLASDRGEDIQLTMLRYANERLLYRLASSKHAGSFVLKGATVFTVWTGSPHRATRDIDLLGYGEPSEERMRGIMADLLALDVVDDGVVFDASSIKVGPIREDQLYGGLRVVLIARIVAARIKCQIDIGFSDAITPDAAMVELPGVLDFPAPRLRAYPPETVVAEKLHAMVQLSMTNSRMKDFYDLVHLANHFTFDGELLVRALRSTFEKRGTPLPDAMPVALTSEFFDDAAKRTQWSAFVGKIGADTAADLGDTVATIAAFAVPLLAAATRGAPWKVKWPPGGPWT